MTQDQRRRVIAGLNARSEVDAFEAAKQVWSDSDRTLTRPLVGILLRGSRPFNRAAAAHALPALRDPKAIPALERTVSASSESPRVRGEAAEALAYFHRKESHRVLLRGLQDPSREVRFWCAFALSHTRDAKALLLLKRLATKDHRIVHGWWSVSKEATDAIRHIKKNRRAWRRCLRCASVLN